MDQTMQWMGTGRPSPEFVLAQANNQLAAQVAALTERIAELERKLDEREHRGGGS